MVITRVPVEEKNVKLLQYLDVLKDIKNILDSDINISLRLMRRYISELSLADQKRLLSLAERYYSPQVRTLVGMLFSALGLSVPNSLVRSLNPTTTYKLALDSSKWPLAKQWKIE